MLAATFKLRRGTFELEVDLQAGPGEVVAVLGPNGAGKTTLLRALAGLEAVSAGCVTLPARIVDDPAHGVFVPPERRETGVVFQEGLLFPNLSVLDNVAFGARAAGRAARRKVAGAWLERLGVGAQSGLRPRQLSGGQAQRVALARALAREPSLLLLDEPLAALDASTRLAVRRELRAHLRDFAGTALLVTHDPVDAALADRVVVLESGRVTDTGPLAELTARPRSRYLADLAGLNLWRGTSDGSTVVVGTTRLRAGGPPGEVYAALRPEAVTVSATEPARGEDNRLRGRVVGIEAAPLGARVSVDAGLPVVAALEAGHPLLAGVEPPEVWVSFAAGAVAVYGSRPGGVTGGAAG